MKKVLIITYYWPPSGGSGVQRWVKFCKYLPSLGWKPVIYAPLNPEYTSIDKTLGEDVPREAIVLKRKIWEPYNAYRRLLGKGSSVDINALTAGATGGEVNPISKGKKSFTKKLSLFIRGNCFIPDPRCWWVGPSYRYLKEYLEENPVDVMVTTGPPHSMHLIGRKLARKTGIPWISDFRDPWTKMYYYKDLELTAWADMRHHRLEQAVLDESTRVLAVTPLMQEDFQAMTKTPVEMITNGYDEVDFDQVVEDDGNFNITHTGLFSADGNPEVLWKVLSAKCKADPEFKSKMRLRLVGKSDAEIIDSIKRADLEENLLDFGYQSHNTAIREQKSASILILPLRNDPDYRPILPGKLFEYLAAKRPILGIGQEDGAMARVLSQTGAGVTYDWSNEAAIAKYIDDSWCKYKADTLDCNSVGIEQFSRRNLTVKLVALMDSLLDK